VVIHLFFGDSYVYIIFEDGTDLYWARSRVLEYLSQVSGQLPDNAKPALGPDATGVGWVFEYALVDRSGRHDLAQLRSLQDWFLKYELQTVPGVAEVATIGGMVRQYQVVVDPDKLRAFGITLAKIKMAIQQGNQETGGSVIEMGEAEYMVRASGYLQGLDDLSDIPLGVNAQGTPLMLADVAEIRLGPQMRRGIAELNGEGEVVGAVVVMRWGENALTTIEAVKERLAELQRSLPDGVEIVTTYDRSDLIERAVETLEGKLLEEFLVVALVCAVFLFHLRSSAVIILSLPVGILIAFIVMKQQGINANIMSLGGIAIAIGAESLANHGRRCNRSRSTAIFLAPDHHPELSAGIHARGTGRSNVRAAGVHKNLCHGSGGGAFDHAGASTDGLLHSWQDHTGAQESDQPGTDRHVPAGHQRGHSVSAGDPGARSSDSCCWFVARHQTRLGVHAAIG